MGFHLSRFLLRFQKAETETANAECPTFLSEVLDYCFTYFFCITRHTETWQGRKTTLFSSKFFGSEFCIRRGRNGPPPSLMSGSWLHSQNAECGCAG